MGHAISQILIFGKICKKIGSTELLASDLVSMVIIGQKRTVSRSESNFEYQASLLEVTCVIHSFSIVFLQIINVAFET